MDDLQQRTRILFFRQGSFSHINDRVAGWLSEQFPTRELVQIDVLQDVLKTARSVVWRGAAAAVLTYFRRIAEGERDFRDLIYRTPYLFRAIRGLIVERYSGVASSALFSFQTQSLYDAGIEGLPHFLYTDHTHLANLRYPGAGARQLFSPRWIELEKSIYHRARTNLVMSCFIRDSLLRDYLCPPSRVAIVGAAPNIDPPNSPPENAGYSNRTILFVGVDWERKGGPILLSAFRMMLAKLPDARLLIAGCAPAIHLPNVEILGRVSLPEVSRLLLRSSVAALPSLREPQGISAIETLMHGIPLVASDIGALPEVVLDRQCGRIVPPNDAAALASALIEILADPALARSYGEAGREHVLANYSSPVVSRKIGDAIRAGLGNLSP